MCSYIQKCTRLACLDLRDCNIYLQEGITRSRTLLRTQLTDTFSRFEHLRRLDISFNYLLGCLGEILDSLQRPLDFLSVRGCDLNEQDLVKLSTSKHAPHLRELDLSKLCYVVIYESDRISPEFLITVLKCFPKLVVLNISQNGIPDASVGSFCEVLTRDLTRLKGLDISGNILQFDNQLELVRACAKVEPMQWLRLTCMNNLLNHDAPVVNQMASRLNCLLKSLGRDDISVDVVRLKFALLVDIIDIFD